MTKCHSVKLNVGQGNVSCTVGPPSHISLWRIIVKYAQPDAYLCLAKKCDCTEYDMFGVSPNPDPSHPMYGLYRFKQGFGGEIFHQLGCWDYPIDDEKYNYFVAKEMGMQGYYAT